MSAAWSPPAVGESQISSPTWLATWLRMLSVTCWYRAAVDSLDQPISDITVGVGCRRTSSTVAAVCLASCNLDSRGLGASRQARGPG